VEAVLQRDADIALSDREMDRIVRLVYERSGITLHQGKRALIVARLHRLLKAGGFTSFSQYVRHVETDHTGHQLSVLLDAITTNHTSFFREDEHFRYLATRVVPPLAAAARPVRVWCAACSTGQEPITLTVTLMEALPQAQHDRIRLLASDISTRALKTAGAGVYPMRVAAGVPPSLLMAYFERGLGADEGKVRVQPHVRRAIVVSRIAAHSGSSVFACHASTCPHNPGHEATNVCSISTLSVDFSISTL